MAANDNLPKPRRWREVTATWLSDLVDTVLSLRVFAGPGVWAEREPGGQVVGLTDEALYPIRPAIVQTAAIAATVASGVRTVKWGTMRLVVADDVNVATDPPTVKVAAEARAASSSYPDLPFYNAYTSGGSAASGKLIWVVRTPMGWAVAINEC